MQIFSLRLRMHKGSSYMWKKRTAIFVSSQTVSLFGSALVQYALFWYVTLETKSGIAMTVFIVCGFLPTFFLSPFGGVWADRYNRKKLIMFSDGFIAAVTLILAAAFISGGNGLALVIIIAALRAVGTAIQGPAVGAILPQLVPVEHLTRVNGISQTIQAVITILAPVVSGALFSVYPLYVILFIDVVTAAIAILILMFFLEFLPARKESDDKKSYFNDMKLGFIYIKEHPYLISFFSFFAVTLFLITPAAMLSPLQVARTFGSDVWRLTAIEIAFSGGMLLGGFFISLWGGFKNRMVTILISTAFMAVCSAGLGIATSFTLYIVIMAILGITAPFFHTPSAVMIQEHVEESFLGRVFSVNTMLFTSIMPLGMLIYGPVAENIRIETIMIITGIVMFVFVAIAFMQKQLIEAGRAVKKEDSKISES